MFFMSILANMAHPVTPELVVSLNMSSLMYGIMFAAMSIASFVMSPIWGGWSDRYKTRKLFLSLPSIGYGLAQIGFGFVTNPVMIIIFRVIGGAFASSVFTNAIAYIVDETEPSNRSKAISYYTAITGFGVSLGYLVGGYIGAKDYHYSFVFQSIGLIVHAVIVYFFLPESNIKSNSTKISSTHSIIEVKVYFKKYLTTVLGIMLLLVLLTSFSLTTYTTGINYFLKKYLNLTPLQIGYYMAATGILGMIANMILTPKIANRYGDNRALRYVLLTAGITLVILAMMDNLFSPIAITIFIVFIFAFSMFKPLLQTMISNESKDEHGKIMGLQNSANSVGMVGGSVFAGAMLDNYSKMPFILAAVIFVLSYIIIRFNKKLNK